MPPTKAASTIVPIVEPEVLIDGDHSMARCAEVTEAVLHEVFHALHSHRVVLKHLLLKPGLVLPGEAHAQQARPAEVAAQTIRILRRTAPAAVASVNFLCGGQTPEEATANLDAMNRLGKRGLIHVELWRLGWDGQKGSFCSRYRGYLQENQRSRPPKPITNRAE